MNGKVLRIYDQYGFKEASTETIIPKERFRLISTWNMIMNNVTNL